VMWQYTEFAMGK